MKIENAVKWFLKDYALTPEEAAKLPYSRKVKRWLGEMTIRTLTFGVLIIHYYALAIDDEYCQYP